MQRPSASTLRRAARTALWGGLVAMHGVPMGKVIARLADGGPGWGSLALLLATQALFVAKWADVRWLRMPSRRGTILSFLLATALAHPQTTFEHLGEAAPAAGAAVLVLAPAVRRAKPRQWLRAAERRVDLWRQIAAVGVRREAFLAPRPLCLVPVRPGRAPPVRFHA